MTMSKTDLRDRVLNVFYPDKRSPNELTLGSEIQVRVAMPWIGAAPTVIWFYRLRCLVAEDAAYIREGHYPADTLFAPDARALLSSDDYAYRRFKIPHHGGIQYSLYARLGTGGTQLVKQFTTWRRIYIDLVTQKPQQTQRFHQSLPLIVAAFAEAYIEVVLSKITVNGQLTQPSKNPHADRDGSTTIEVSLKDETEDAVAQKLRCQFRKAPAGLVLEQVNGRQPNFDPERPRFTVVGMQLQIEQNFAKTQWDPTPRFFREVRFEDGQGQAIGPSGAWLGDVQDAQGQPIVPAEPLHKIARRVDARTVRIDLGNAAVGPWLNALPEGATFFLIARLQSLAWGGNRGGAIAGTNRAEISFAPQLTAEGIACTVVHEIGHILKLAVQSETKPNGQADNNPKYYEGHGGAGPHCKHNVDNPNALPDEPYRPPENNNRLCVMYHATVPEKMNAAKFCPTCLGHLRRRSVPAMPTRPKPVAPRPAMPAVPAMPAGRAGSKPAKRSPAGSPNRR